MTPNPHPDRGKELLEAEEGHRAVPTQPPVIRE